MKDLNELIGTLVIETANEDKDEAFKTVIREIEKFYIENYNLNNYEVAIFIANKGKVVLSFACPEYLVDSGMIPVTSTEAVIANIFQTGKGIIMNNVRQHKHLSIFEVIPIPSNGIKPIWKMMGSLIEVEGEKIGTIEISRRAANEHEVDEDFTDQDFRFLERTMKKLAPFIKKVMPENFRGKIT